MEPSSVDAPYTITVRDNGTLYFFAEVPRLSHIGRRLDELLEARLHHELPAADRTNSDQFVNRLQQFAREAKKGTAPPWPVISKQLDREPGGYLRLVRGHMPTKIHAMFEAGKISLGDYLEAHVAVATIEGSRARGFRLVEMLKLIVGIPLIRRLGFRSSLKTVPRWLFIAVLMPFALCLVFVITVVGLAISITVLTVDAMREMLGKIVPAVRRSEPSPTSWVNWVPGRLLFDCGQRDVVSSAQIALFRQFMDEQDVLCPAIESALRQMHAWMREPGPFRDHSDALLYPDDLVCSDVPLQCFRIRDVELRPEFHGRIVLTLESLFGHLDEHGCYILIRDGKIENFGTWDEVLADEDADEDMGDSQD